ncbi:MAG TPA: 50S ribosomal protein L23 [Gemmatimonadaceae bacterium]|nr:50S ribosomal protein L23 [Gemmatimonadaceae bacterium]
MPTLTRTIVTPIVTEQTSAAYQDRGEYAFRVDRKATKTQIRKAIEELFNVRVSGVWTSNHRGKDRRIGQTVGRRPHWKKAIVRLAEGDSIDIFEA